VFVEAKVDDRLKLDTSLSDMSWKAKAKLFHVWKLCFYVVPIYINVSPCSFQDKRLMEENKIIYERIAKVEACDSKITQEAREHVRRVESVREYDRRIREDGRRRIENRIERENIFFQRRLENVKSTYSRKRFQDEYKYHILFKNGR
jgi:hypothetical protein